MEVVREEAQRDEDKHDVQPRAEEEEPVGLDPPWLVLGNAEDANDTFLVREPVDVAVRAMAVLEEGSPVGWRHLRQWMWKKSEEGRV